MPYYKWRGVDLVGRYKKGVLFARSTEHLDQLLLKRRIALLKSKKVRTWGNKAISLSDRLALFQQLATLIAAGVHLPDALMIVANQVEHTQLQEKLHAIMQYVEEGFSLSSSLWKVEGVASPITIQLIHTGEESGTLVQSLEAICEHLAATQDFYRRLRSALLLPIVTLLFFFIVGAIIFTVIMPRFVDIFSSMQSQLPSSTLFLLSISEFMRSAAMGLFISVIALCLVISWRATRRGYGRILLDRLWLSMPVLGPILKQRFVADFSRAMAVLLQGGVPLAESLEIIRDTTNNNQFCRYLLTIAEEIQSGSSLSDALAREGTDIFGSDIVAMVEVGQESGRLPLLLQRVSQTYHMRVMTRLSWVTMLVQPTVMLLLGLLVALLIFAVYGPILSMSRLV